MATIPVMKTWAAGPPAVSAADLNAQIRDAGNFFLKPPAARLTPSGAQNVTSGTTPNANPLTLDSVSFDTDSMTGVNANALTVRTPGIYMLSAIVRLAPSTACPRYYVDIYINGTRYATWEGNTLASGDPTQGGDVLAALNAGDKITVNVGQTSGSTQTTVSGQSFLSAYWIGKAA